MLHVRSLEGLALGCSHLTIGAFDGVHRGHRRLIEEMTAAARADACRSVVLTFFPHPSVVLSGRRPAFYITSPEERAELLAGLGVEVVITHPFDLDVSRIRASDFVDRLLRHVGMKRLWVGQDFALGYRREGDVAFLRREGETKGFGVQVVEPVRDGDEVISSSGVREALHRGDVTRAARFLGRPIALPGEVVGGSGRGRTLGIPTANLKVWEERATPANGVYACWAEDLGRRLKAVTNIGTRPTFDAGSPTPTIEAHLLDFEGDLYGHGLRLEFVERLRDEMKFPSPEALRAQIQSDIARARVVLEATAVPQT